MGWFTVKQKDRGCWKHLHDNIVYYQHTEDVEKKSLKIMNVQNSLFAEYNRIHPRSVKNFCQLKYPLIKVIIDTQNSKLIGLLDISNLKLKVKYRLFTKYMMFGTESHYCNNNLFVLLNNVKAFQFRGTKLIRAYKGDIQNIIPFNLLFNINIVNKWTKQYILNIFQSKFNIDTSNLYVKVFQNYIVLRSQQKTTKTSFERKTIYYINKNIIFNKNEHFGQFILKQEEQLKAIKSQNNQLFIVIKIGQYIQIFKILNVQDKELVFNVSFSKYANKFKKPILNIDTLSLSIQDDSQIILRYKVDLFISKQQKKK
ncbi:hypothetical protein pb186bvf_020474 [Paramecium bursaria]